MTRAWLLALVLGGCAAASDDDPSEIPTPSVSEAQLSDVEWSMVGTWRGSLPDDRWSYYVFTADRQGCFFDREGDDFGRRYSEVHFVTWAVEVDAVDDELLAPISFDAIGGDHHDHDRYDMGRDRLLPSGFSELALSWLDVRIDCDDEGIDAVESDVERLGWMAGDDTTGGPGAPTGGGGTGGSGGSGGPGGPSNGTTSTGGGGPSPP